MTSSKPALEPRALHGGVRNPGVPFRLEWVQALTVDEPMLVRRATGLADEALGEDDEYVERLLLAIRLMDLTSLSDDDTDESVRLLCAKALAPLSAETLAALGRDRRSTTVAAVCVHDRFVGAARDALEGSGVRVAAVTAGFPVGLPSLADRLHEIRAAVASGADEIDVVIDRHPARIGDWQTLYDEVTAFRASCGPARLKTILATHDLGGLQTVARAGLVCSMAGADFIKTSTGREAVNATVPVGLAMAAAIRSFADQAGYAVGLKPAGGLREASDALAWIELVHGELGPSWLHPTYLRLGASSLLGSIQNALAERLGPR